MNDMAHLIMRTYSSIVFKQDKENFYKYFYLAISKYDVTIEKKKELIDFLLADGMYDEAIHLISTDPMIVLLRLTDSTYAESLMVKYPALRGKSNK